MPMFGDRKPFAFLQEKYNTRYPGVFARYKMDGVYIVRGRA